MAAELARAVTLGVHGICDLSTIDTNHDLDALARVSTASDPGHEHRERAFETRVPVYARALRCCCVGLERRLLSAAAAEWRQTQSRIGDECSHRADGCGNQRHDRVR